jgi:NitT/TauT family transport system substrate-binding protein
MRHVKPTQHMRSLGYVIAAAAALSAMTPEAMAEDSLKVAVDQRGAWETAVPELGQQAGIFKKHGLTLDLTYPRAESEIETAVISGSTDVGVGVGIVEVLRAYATKEAPIRIIGATMTGSANYWYVAASSPIKTITDISGRTIAYSKGDASSQYDVFDLMQRYRVKPRPVLIAGAAATFDQVMAGKIDVGWATPPFGGDALEQGRIRVLAKANDIPKIHDKTVSVTIASTDTLQKRKDVLDRFMQAYRETIEWMYSDPAAPKTYAEFAGIPEEVARRMRDEFFAKDMLSPNSIVGLSATSKEAAKSKQIWAALSRKQMAELVQIPPPQRANASTKGGGWFRAFAPKSP